MPRNVSMNGCLGGLFILFTMMAGLIVFLILVSATANSHEISVLSMWPMVWIVCAIIGGPTLAIGVLFVFRYRREKHVLQWGKAAPAKIIGEDEIETRSGRVAKVRYSFEDDNGVTRENTRSLPVSDDPRPGFTEERARYLNNPTAVFDPRNSKRNVLYPGHLLEMN
jgi:hypothetical protein